MARRSCVLPRFSSNGGGLRVEMRKTPIRACNSYETLHLTKSADLPVRPFGAEPAAPAFATGASPEVPAAAPASALLAIAAVLLLGIAAPASASKCFDSKHRPQACRVKAGPGVAAAPAKRVAPPTTIVLKGVGGGGVSPWPQIAADLMP